MLWIIINCYNTTFLAHNLEILQVMGCKGVDIPGVHYQNPVHRCLADNGCPRCPPHGRDLTSVVGMGPAQHQGSVEPRGSWESPFALTLHLTTLLCNLRCFHLHADPPACLHFQGWDQSSMIPQNSLSGTSRRSLGQRNIHFAQRSCHVTYDLMRINTRSRSSATFGGIISWSTSYRNIACLQWFERCWNPPVHISVPLVLPREDYHSLSKTNYNRKDLMQYL